MSGTLRTLYIAYGYWLDIAEHSERFTFMNCVVNVNPVCNNDKLHQSLLPFAAIHPLRRIMRLFVHRSRRLEATAISVNIRLVYRCSNRNWRLLLLVIMTQLCGRLHDDHRHSHSNEKAERGASFSPSVRILSRTVDGRIALMGRRLPPRYSQQTPPHPTLPSDRVSLRHALVNQFLQLE